jgi:transposase
MRKNILLLIPDFPLPTPHSPFPIPPFPHSAFRIPHSAFRIPHSLLPLLRPQSAIRDQESCGKPMPMGSLQPNRIFSLKNQVFYLARRCWLRYIAARNRQMIKAHKRKNDGSIDLANSFAPGLPKITIQIYQTPHMIRLFGQGFEISSTIRLRMDERGVWVELILDKERPELRTEGKVIGIDRGFRKAFVTSDGQEIGVELMDQINRKDKRSKRAYRHIQTELFRHLKRLKLEGVKTIVLEDLRYIKHGKRGTFSRQINWQFAISLVRF